MSKSKKSRIAALEKKCAVNAKGLHIIERQFMEPILNSEGVPIGSRHIGTMRRVLGQGSYSPMEPPDDVPTHHQVQDASGAWSWEQIGDRSCGCWACERHFAGQWA